MALLIIFIMLLLGIILALYYIPRPQKPFNLNRDYKFEAGQELTPHIPQIDTNELYPTQIDYKLPDKYDEDQICLMVRDPEWLFAFWEISTKTRFELASKYGTDFFAETIQVIRVYNLSEAEDSSYYFDINISEEHSRWHFNIAKPNNKFYISLGRLKANGEFIPILNSNTVHIPRNNVSPALDENWLPYLGNFDNNLYENSLAFSSLSFYQERKD